jgi:hypothetical protein
MDSQPSRQASSGHAASAGTVQRRRSPSDPAIRRQPGDQAGKTRPGWFCGEHELDGLEHRSTIKLRGIID